MKFINFKYLSRSLAGLIIIYLVIRAINVDITHDEAYSFHNIKKFWYAEFLCTGNSHWLNSSAIAFSSFLNLEKNYHLRWLTLIAAIIFVVVILKWSGSLKGQFSSLFAVCLLLLNPYVLDYFVLARGYGLSIMLEFFSLYLMFCSFKRKSHLIAGLSLFFACLSAISQYSFLYFLIAFVIVYLYVNYFKEKFTFKKNKVFYIDVFVTLSSFVLIFLAIRFISRCSNDYLGAGTEVFFNSIKSVFECGTYGSVNWNGVLLSVISFLCIILLLFSLYWGLAKVRHQNPAYYYLSLIIVMVFCFILIAKFLFVGVFPEGRSALFLFPLICMNLIYFLDTVLKNVFVQNTTMLVLSILLGINFALSLNFNCTYDYREQSETHAIYNFIQITGANNIGVSGELYGVYANYYQVTDKLKYGFKAEVINTHKPAGVCNKNNWLNKFDYLLLYPPYNLSYYKSSKLKVSAAKLFEPNKVLFLKINR